MAGVSSSPGLLRAIQWRVVGFGFLLALSSTFGQTHFFSLFNVALREEFALSHTEIGSVYSLATLCSASLLAWLGRQLDHRDLRHYTTAVIFGLAAAAAAMATANGLATLFIACFLLRLCGQGLSSHVGLTVTARLATRHRGKSLSVAGLGFTTGEFLAPLVIGTLLVTLPWRQVWGGVALVQVIAIMAVAHWLLRGLDRHPPANTASDISASDRANSWRRGQVIRDRRFFRFMPALLVPPFLITALLFHQASLAEHHDVSVRAWTTGFIAYPLAAAACALLGGTLVDRFGSFRVLTLSLPLIMLGIAMPLAFDFAGLAFVYYGIVGSGIGIGAPAVTSLWREIYGTVHLGANLAMGHALIVLSSAAGPVVFGLLLDAGLGWPIILGLSLGGFAALYLLFTLTNLSPMAPPLTAGP